MKFSLRFLLIIVMVVSVCIPLAVRLYHYYDYPQHYITQFWEHHLLDDSRVLRLYEDESYINYRFTAGATTWGPTAAHIPKESKWFAFVETRDRVWIYDGIDDLALLSKTEKGTGSYSVKVCGDWLMQEIPLEVRSRIPKRLGAKSTLETNSQKAEPK